MNRLKINSVVLILSLLWINLSAQNSVRFDTTNWILAKNAKIDTFMDKEVLIGTAYLKGVEMDNGIIEVDLFSTGARNFGGFMFHVQSFDNYEWCWLRMHKTNGYVQDGVQYAPVLNGTSCWQLNGGVNGIAPVDLPKNKWVHLKLDIQNDTARLFVENMQRPVLIMDNLQIDKKNGSIGVKGLLHDGLYFANFSYTQRKSGEKLQVEGILEKGVIADWKLSSRFRIKEFSETESYPYERLKNINEWISPDVRTNGLINLTKYYGHNPNDSLSCAILQTNILTNENGIVKMNFGYSDAVTIFLNEKPIFSGNSAYRSRNMAFGGWINYEDALYLDLNRGVNNLVIVIAEYFGGWGFQAKINDDK